MKIYSEIMLQKTLVFIVLSLILSACFFRKSSIDGQLIEVEGEIAFLQTPENTIVKLPVKVKDLLDLEKSKKNYGKCYRYEPRGSSGVNQRYTDIRCDAIGMTTFGDNDGYVGVLDKVEKSGNDALIRFAGRFGDFTVNAPPHKELRSKTGSCFRYNDNRSDGGTRTLTELEDIKCENLQSRRNGGFGDDIVIFGFDNGSGGSRISSGGSSSRSSSGTRSGGSFSRTSSGSIGRSSSLFSSGRSGFGGSSVGRSSGR